MFKQRFDYENFVTVVIPTLNEEENIDRVLGTFDFDSTKRQLVIVDGGSIDKTVNKVKKFIRGTRTFLNLKIINSEHTGKGYQMIRGYEEALGSTIVYLDADLKSDYSELVEKLSQPILEEDYFFVKSKFDRGDDWGRVTKLTAQPLLQIFYPDLLWVSQPLSGQVAFKKGVLELIEFPANYGVEVSHLIQYYNIYGLNHLYQADLGVLQHRHRTLSDLQLTAEEVSKTIFYHAYRDGKIDMKLPLLEKLLKSSEFI